MATAASSPSCFIGQKLPSSNTTSSLPAPSCIRFRSPRVAATYTTAEKTRSPHLYTSNLASPESLYELLGVPTGATSKEIKAAYRRLARVCHPDAVATDRKDTSANEFMKIHAAYSTLSDPQKRTDYDRDLFSRQRLYRSPPSAFTYSAASAASSLSGFSGYTRKNWETDQCW
ncbi:chaperone protein dnaJ 11, chloroplastic-like [Macadamia integrifolia]|uniref:chaperone protein dnaJ 11, chloroplastic-like n=1 Tax=Macadamia integrifolia TaxID=60698 RepID=UPI001C4EAAA1|nr:chaperone protein dnaJ 11, chloroplastic-like [Macadamia integrifolia]